MTAGDTFSANSICPKCWHGDVATFYEPDTHGHLCKEHRDNRTCCTDEHFHRTCQRCRFTWREEVLSGNPPF